MRFLCISGGGVWGVGVAHFCKLMSSRIAEPREYFEGFAGTSTGAIIAACFAHGLTSKEVDDLYRSKIKKIFTKNSWWARLKPSTPRYTNRELKKILEEIFGNTKMHQLKKPCWITAWRVNGKNNNKVWGPQSSKLVRDVVLASASAPTYFPVHNIEGTEYMDGGLWANNPAMCAICDSNYVKLDDLKVLTLITSGNQRGVKTGNMGYIKLGKYLASRLITGRVTGTDYMVQRLVKNSYTVCPEIRTNYDLDDVKACNKIRRVWEAEYSRVQVLLQKFMNNI